MFLPFLFLYYFSFYPSFCVSLSRYFFFFSVISICLFFIFAFLFFPDFLFRWFFWFFLFCQYLSFVFLFFFLLLYSSISFSYYLLPLLYYILWNERYFFFHFFGNFDLQTPYLLHANVFLPLRWPCCCCSDSSCLWPCFLFSPFIIAFFMERNIFDFWKLRWYGLKI